MPLWNIIWQYLEKLELLYDPEIPHPGVYPRKLKTCVHTKTFVLPYFLYSHNCYLKLSFILTCLLTVSSYSNGGSLRTEVVSVLFTPLFLNQCLTQLAQKYRLPWMNEDISHSLPNTPLCIRSDSYRTTSH